MITDTNPVEFRMKTVETIPLGIDMTAELPTGGTVSSPTSTLIDQADGTVIALGNSPTVSGNVVTQVLVGSQLTAGHRYTLQIVYTAATSTVLATTTTIVVS